MPNLPSFQSYGRYSNDNYGLNTLQVYLDGITLWYSYRTIVAFWTPEDGRVVCENAWGVTTGKHLNWIQPDHDSRLPVDQFDNKLRKAISRIFKSEEEA